MSKEKEVAKANILVLGTSGAGKSTLINTVMGKEVAKVGSGRHVTEKMESYESDELNFRLIDSRGFEYSIMNSHKTVKDMKTWLKEGLKDNKPRIHMLWFCIDATSKRFVAKNLRRLEEVKKEWPDVPIIVVLTKSFFVAEDEENIAMVKDTFRKLAKKTGMPIAIIPVLSEPPKGEEIMARGIDVLIETTVANIDEAVRISDEAVIAYESRSRRRMAQAATIGATTSATVVGAIPIDFPDAVILTTLETSLITGIARIYKLDKKEETTKKIISRIVEAGTVSMAAKAVINQLKLIPGLANVAADVINAIVAGAIVLSIGEGTIVVMEKVYAGEIDAKDLDVVDNLIEGKMGRIVTILTNIVGNSDAKKINAVDILKAVFNQSKDDSE